MFATVPRAVTVAPRPNVVMYAVPEGPSANEEQIVEKAAAAALEEDDEDEVVKKPKVVKERLFWGQKTYYPKLADTRAELKQWYIIDATNLRLGRMATEIANILRGKRKVTYHPAMDMGDFVIVINADKVVVSGKKTTDKLYRRHTTGVPGAMKVETFEELQKRIPERIIEKAVKGMLPKGSLGRELFTHLKVYKGDAHPHAAQKPVEFKFEGALAKAAMPFEKR